MQRSSSKRAATSYTRVAVSYIDLIPRLPSPDIASIEANPAKLSPTLASLFPPGAVAAELREPGDPSLLLPAEAQYLGKAVLKRAQEFAAGRLCARALLAEFGILDFAIEVGEARQPVWPDALVGSITHTAGFCAAVVAEKSHCAAIGMDCELAGSVKPELWPSICTHEEILWLNSLPEASRVDAATLIFSAKEAFYKCQYPLTRERLTLHDARVEAPTWGAAGGTFTILPTRRIALAEKAALPLHGRYLFHQQFMTAGLSLASRDFAR
jgi:enterobactin synthetase component D / holo-[acyl-carrier protein] synthase